MKNLYLTMTSFLLLFLLAACQPESINSVRSQIDDSSRNFATEVPMPNISPNGGSFQTSVNVSISGIRGQDYVTYTTDGSEPSCSAIDSTKDRNTSIQLVVSSSQIIKAISCPQRGGSSMVASASFTITQPPVNQAPVVNAGPAQSITLPSAVSLNGSATDDGLPVGSTLVVTWAKQSGPGTVSFSNRNSPVTTATFSVSGSYQLRLRATDGALTSNSYVNITVNPAPVINQAPVVSAGPDQSITLPNSASLNGSVTDDGLPVGSTLTRQWSKVSGPGTVTFANASSQVTTAAFSLAGSYVLRLTGSDGALSSSSNVTITVNPAPTTPPPSGNTINVPAGGNLQNAINQAQFGDTILLAPGATYSGSFRLPLKTGGTNTDADYITIRIADESLIPPAGQRINPSYASVLPKILANQNWQPAIYTATAARHYRFVGVHIALANSNPGAYQLVELGNDGAYGQSQTTLAAVPRHFIFDRVYIQGSDTKEVRRGIALNSSHTLVVNSYIEGINQPGYDSQAIGGWNGPGPFTIHNNFLEAASENILFGGAPPAIPNLIPSDIVITKNHIHKPLRWRGQNRTVKNIIQLKAARRVHIEGNILENVWEEAQVGAAFSFTTRSEGYTWNTVTDVTVVNNLIKNAASGLQLMASDDWGEPGTPSQNMIIRNNFFDLSMDINNWGRLFQLSHGGNNIKFSNNTCINRGNITHFYTNNAATNLEIENNIMFHNSYGWWTESGWNVSFAHASIRKNVTVRHDQYSSIPNPSQNFMAQNLSAVGFINPAAKNYRLAPSSPYKNAGTDGRDIGADFDLIDAATQGVLTGNPGN